jgi:2'-hydroxyisoflavone reductase
MKYLILGGTAYLGRHAVDAARARGHEVTIFNRGRTNPDLFPDVERLRGDRDGDLAALAGRSWDAVLDPSGYLPRVVRASCDLLRDSVGHYCSSRASTPTPIRRSPGSWKPTRPPSCRRTRRARR